MTGLVQDEDVQLGVVGLPDVVGTLGLTAVDELVPVPQPSWALMGEGDQVRVEAGDDRVDAAVGRDRPVVRGCGLGHLAGDRRPGRAGPGQGQTLDERHELAGQPVAPAVSPLPPAQTAHTRFAVTAKPPPRRS